MKNVCAVLIVLLLHTGMASPLKAFSRDQSTNPALHAIPNDYTFRTDQVVLPIAEKEKTFWDYLSFFEFAKHPQVTALVPAEEATDLKLHVRELGQQLLKNARESIVDDQVVTVSSFVNLDNLYQVSAFGRYIGEQLIGELQLAGVEVIDVRKTPGMMIREGKGEYALSRDMSELSYIHAAQSTIVGTYTYANNQVLLNARLLHNQNGLVLSQANLVFDLDPLTEKLLADDGMPARHNSTINIQALN